jgi:hypothetical protein
MAILPPRALTEAGVAANLVSRDPPGSKLDGPSRVRYLLRAACIASRLSDEPTRRARRSVDGRMAVTGDRPRVVPSSRRVLAGLVLLGGIGILAGLFVLWRRAHGAIDLGFLVPRIERALGGALPSGSVRLGGAELVWDSTTHRPALHVRDVRLLAPGGEPLAVLPVLAVRPSLRALRHRTLAAERIELIGAQLRAVRTPEGRFALSFGAREETGGPDLLERLHALRDGPAAWLRRVELRDGTIVLTDPSSGTTWSASGVDLAITRRPDSLALDGAAALGAARAPVRLEAVYRAEPPGVDASLRFERLVPAAAATLVAGEGIRDALARIDVPFEGTLSAVLDGDLGLQWFRLDTESGAGRIVVAELPAREVAIRRLGLVAVFDAAAQTLDVETLAVDLGTTRVDVRGRLFELRAARRLDVTAKVAGFPAGDLAAWWPGGVAEKARAWVTTRITQGTIREATVRLVGSMPERRFAAETVEGAAAFDGLTVRYLDKLPPARALAGTATLKDGRWQFHLARGAVDDLEVVRGSVGIEARKAGIDVALRGPLATALDLAERSGAGELGIPRDGVGGAVTGTVRLEVPFRAGLHADDLNLAISARLSDVAVARAFRGWSFAGGDLDLDLRQRALHVAGRGRLEAAPIDVVWDEDLNGATRRRRVEVTGRLDAPARASLGLESRPWLDGPIGTRVRLADEAGNGTLDVDVDLADASLDISVLAVAKAPGSPGLASARITIAGGRAARVDPFSFSAGGSSLAARATLGPDGRSLRTLDADATIAARDARSRAGRVTLAARGNEIVITSSDAGALFRALGPGMDASGGRLRYAGTFDLDAADASIDGRLEVRDFTLRRASALARVATLASLSGIAGALERDGIRFDSLDAGIGQRGSTIAITDAVLRGRALGLLAAGTIDRSARSAAVRGTLVPSFYGLNTLPGRVPVLGSVVAGKGREGVQAIDFTITGPLDAPQVAVSPSSLAPGALRDLVRRFGGDRR